MYFSKNPLTQQTLNDIINSKYSILSPFSTEIPYLTPSVPLSQLSTVEQKLNQITQKYTPTKNNITNRSNYKIVGNLKLSKVKSQGNSPNQSENSQFQSPVSKESQLQNNQKISLFTAKKTPINNVQFKKQFKEGLSSRKGIGSQMIKPASELLQQKSNKLQITSEKLPPLSIPNSQQSSQISSPIKILSNNVTKIEEEKESPVIQTQKSQESFTKQISPIGQKFKNIVQKKMCFFNQEIEEQNPKNQEVYKPQQLHSVRKFSSFKEGKKAKTDQNYNKISPRLSKKLSQHDLLKQDSGKNLLQSQPLQKQEFSSIDKKEIINSEFSEETNQQRKASSQSIQKQRKPSITTEEQVKSDSSDDEESLIQTSIKRVTSINEKFSMSRISQLSNSNKRSLKNILQKHNFEKQPQQKTSISFGKKNSIYELVVSRQFSNQIKRNNSFQANYQKNNMILGFEQMKKKKENKKQKRMFKDRKLEIGDKINHPWKSYQQILKFYYQTAQHKEIVKHKQNYKLCFDKNEHQFKFNIVRRYFKFYFNDKIVLKIQKIHALIKQFRFLPSQIERVSNNLLPDDEFGICYYSILCSFSYKPNLEFEYQTQNLIWDDIVNQTKQKRSLGIKEIEKKLSQNRKSSLLKSVKEFQQYFALENNQRNSIFANDLIQYNMKIAEKQFVKSHLKHLTFDLIENPKSRQKTNFKDCLILQIATIDNDTRNKMLTESNLEEQDREILNKMMQHQG